MTITRWNPCPAEPEEDDDGPLFQGFLTDTQGEWVKWEDIATLGSHASDLHELRTVQALNEKMQKEMTTVRDNLRNLLIAWHKRGPHATYDGLVIEKAILDLSALTK